MCFAGEKLGRAVKLKHADEEKKKRVVATAEIRLLLKSRFAYKIYLETTGKYLKIY